MKLFACAAVGATVALIAAPVDARAQTGIRIGRNRAPDHMASTTWYDETPGYLVNSDEARVARPIHFRGSGHQATAIAAGQADIAAMSPVASV